MEANCSKKKIGCYLEKDENEAWIDEDGIEDENENRGGVSAWGGF